MTAPILSTRDRRVRQTELVMLMADGGARGYWRGSASTYSDGDERHPDNANDRRRAGCRGSIDTWVSETACHDESCKLAHPKRDLILALRRAPDGVVVAEGVEGCQGDSMSSRVEEALTAYGVREFECGQVQQTGRIPKWLRDARREACEALLAAVAAEVEKAVKAERERCASICIDTSHERGGLDAFTLGYVSGCNEVYRRILAIRGGKDE